MTVGTPESLVYKYRESGILVDSNLLLLLFVGVCDPHLISTFKRLSSFTEEDLDLLLSFMNSFRRRLTTPHILTEVSNLANQLPEPVRVGFALTFKILTRTFNEVFHPAIEIMADSEFAALGITDAAISNAARSSVLVPTDDFRLIGKLEKAGVDAINFNHLRLIGNS